MFAAILSTWISVLIGVYCAAAFLGSGAFLFIGLKFIVKTPQASYLRSVEAMFLGILGSVFIAGVTNFIMARAFPLFFLLIINGLFLGFFWTWFVIGQFFKISIGDSIRAWFPVPVFQFALYWLVMSSVVTPIHHNTKGRHIALYSATNLNGIGISIALYKDAHNDVYPSSLDKLIDSSGDITITEQTLRHPGVPADEPRSYFYLPPKINGKDVNKNKLIACEKKNLNKYIEGRNVLFADYTVKFLSAKEFDSELAKPENTVFAAALKQADGP